MMEHDEFISAEHGYTVPQLIEMCNDAVELIWNLQDEICELNEELESYQQAADELIDQLYG